jgi:hypothetical protein
LIKRAILLTLILNSIILIGIPSGHGFGIMILIEYLGVRNIIEIGFEYNKEYPYESGLILIALVSLIGKLILITLLFSKNILNKKYWIYIGLTLMLISFFVVCYNIWDYDSFLFVITLGSGIPFIMYFGRVLYLINKERNKSELVKK